MSTSSNLYSNHKILTFSQGIIRSLQRHYEMDVIGDDSKVSLTVSDVLGSGTQGIVYTTLEYPTWFIKCHREERHFRNEIAVLTSLRGVLGVVQLEAIDYSNRVLAASPICEHLAAFRGKAVMYDLAMQLLDTLRDIHGRGLVHRDARASNFLVKLNEGGDAEQALICDWATSAELDEEEDYEGALHFTADSVLQNIRDGNRSFVFTPAMDLESLAKTVWDLLRRKECGVSQLPREDTSGMLEWWLTRARSEYKLATYLKFARNLDYQGLRDLWAK